MQPDDERSDSEERVERDFSAERDFPLGARELPGAGAPSEDPYTPEPGPRQGERSAFRALKWAWLVVLVVIVIVVVALVR